MSDPRATWRNWSGLETAEPDRVVDARRRRGRRRGGPRGARGRRDRVKMVGTGHSFTAIARAERDDAAARAD